MRQFSPLYLNILIIQNNNQRSQWDDSQMQEVVNEAINKASNFTNFLDDSD
jgi:hypothetical protein